jgi:hypothetical protein
MSFEKKLWANSGDSHSMEPPDLDDQLPSHLQELLPTTVQDVDRGVEIITVDGQVFERPIPTPITPEVMAKMAAKPLEEDLDNPADLSADGMTRAPGASDPVKRLDDLNEEGIWAEAIYPSLGIWTFNIRTPELVQAGCRVSNEFYLDFQRQSPRYVVAASIPLLDVDDAVEEIARCGADGFKLAFLPTRPPIGRPAR